MSCTTNFQIEAIELLIYPLTFAIFCHSNVSKIELLLYVIFSHQINCASVINNCQCLSQRLLCHLQLFHNKNEKNITNDKNKSLRLTEKKFLYNSFFLTVTSCQLKSTLI